MVWYYMGIDEAGWGPVLGPMVYGGLIWPVEFDNKEQLKEVKINDSKQVDKKNWELSFEKLKQLQAQQIIDFQAIAISPQELSDQMEREESISLNEISKNAAFSLVWHFLNLNIDLDTVFIDTVGKESSYQILFENEFKHYNIKFVVKSKADSLFPVVSAASIVAKVTWDFLLENWVFEESFEISRNFGCGYPGDPVTVSWLQQNQHPIWGFPSLVRFSWQTVKTLIDKNGVPYKKKDYQKQVPIQRVKELGIVTRKVTPLDIECHKLHSNMF